MSSRLKVIESDTSPNWYGLNSSQSSGRGGDGLFVDDQNRLMFPRKDIGWNLTRDAPLRTHRYSGLNCPHYHPRTLNTKLTSSNKPCLRKGALRPRPFHRSIAKSSDRWLHIIYDGPRLIRMAVEMSGA